MRVGEGKASPAFRFFAFLAGPASVALLAFAAAACAMPEIARASSDIWTGSDQSASLWMLGATGSDVLTCSGHLRYRWAREAGRLKTHRHAWPRKRLAPGEVGGHSRWSLLLQLRLWLLRI